MILLRFTEFFSSPPCPRSSFWERTTWEKRTEILKCGSSFSIQFGGFLKNAYRIKGSLKPRDLLQSSSGGIWSGSRVLLPHHLCLQMLHKKSQRQNNKDINALSLPSLTPLAGPPVSFAKPWMADVTLTAGFAEPNRSGAGISNPRASATYSRQKLAGTEKECKETLLEVRVLFFCRDLAFQTSPPLLLADICLWRAMHVTVWGSWANKEEVWGNTDTCIERETQPTASAKSPNESQP